MGTHRVKRVVKMRGFARSPERLAHKNMLRRCYNPNNVGYPRYGARGIKVCERWLGEGGFDRFYQDVGPRPDAEHSIDRINNDGDYEPANVRWATPSVQHGNKSTNYPITFRGETKTMSEWATQIGATRHALWRAFTSTSGA